MRRNPVLLLALAVPLAGCEPLRGVVSEKEGAGSVDVACVDAALRKAFGKIERWDYVSDGNGYPKGTKVAQLAYFQPDDGRGWAKLEIGEVRRGTRLKHSFTGVGAELPQEDFPPALRAMEEATAALQVACKLNLAGMRLNSVGQHVEALQGKGRNGS